MRKQYSAEFKAQVVREVLREEKTIGQIASEYGVHPTQVSQWRDKALAGLPELLSRKGVEQQAATQAAHEQQVHELYAEIGRLTTELAWLKKKAGYLDPATRTGGNGRVGGKRHEHQHPG
jgi:putative transposase